MKWGRLNRRQSRTLADSFIQFQKMASSRVVIRTIERDSYSKMKSFIFFKFVNQIIIPNVREKFSGHLIMRQTSAYKTMDIQAKMQWGNRWFRDFRDGNCLSCFWEGRNSSCRIWSSGKWWKKKICRTNHALHSWYHVALILPPYKCDLSQDEFAWAGVKRAIRYNNVDAEDFLNCLRELTSVTVPAVLDGDWKTYCHSVMVINKLTVTV